MAPQFDLADPIVRANPYPMYARMRNEAPVTQARLSGLGNVWVLSRYGDAAQALKESKLYSDRAHALGERSARDKWWLPSMMRAIETSMVMQDDPHHKRLRSLVHQAFTPKMIEQLAAMISQRTDKLLDQVAQQESVDLIESFALPLPLAIISDMMGVPEEDRATFRTLVSRFGADSDILDPPLSALLKTVPTALRLARFFKKLVKLRQTEPGDDVTSRLLQARADGHAQLTFNEVVAMLFLLLFAGHETTVNLIGNGTLALLDNPEQLVLLREKPELIGSAVEELLRFCSPAEHAAMRWTTEEMVYRGVTVPKHVALVPLLGCANRDESEFERGDSLDITRNPNRHIAFGLGIHFCLGAPLARLEGKIAMQALVQRFANIRLAVPRDSIAWRQSPGIRGLRALPLQLS